MTIRNISEISWFNLHDYECVGDFNEQEWFFELNCRLNYYTTPFTGVADTNVASYPFGSSMVGDITRDLRERVAEDYSDVSERFGGELVFTRPTVGGKHHKSMTFELDPDLAPFVYIPNGTKVYSTGLKMPFYIDHAASDEMLLGTFKVIRESFREQIEESGFGFMTPKKIKNGLIGHIYDTDLENWVACGLLPYLDLLQWSLLTGNKIQNKIFARALNLTDGRVRKSTKVQAFEVLNFHRILKKQIMGHWKKPA